jgi:hypothetical protein
MSLPSGCGAAASAAQARRLTLGAASTIASAVAVAATRRAGRAPPAEVRSDARRRGGAARSGAAVSVGARSILRATVNCGLAAVARRTHGTPHCLAAGGAAAATAV